MNPRTLPKAARGGMTIVEALIAMTLLSFAISGAQLLISSMQIGVRSSNQLQVNQSAQRYLEHVQNYWRDNRYYGTLDTTTPPPTSLAGHTWTVTVCPVDLTTGDCGAISTFTEPTAPSYTGSGAVLRLNVAYVRTQGGKTTVASTEVAQP